MPLHDSFQKRTKTNLVNLSHLPTADDLLYALGTCQQTPRMPYQLAWMQGADARVLSIIWGLEPGVPTGTWILRDGEGPNAQTIWKHVCGDAHLMHTLLTEEISAPAPAAVIPDFLLRKPDQPPVEAPRPAPPIMPTVQEADKRRTTTDFQKEVCVGSVFDDRYELVEEVGRGAMGVVYKAKQRVMNRYVALKVLHHHMLTPENWQRLEQEARSASTLSHPNLIVVHDFGKSPLGRPYMVMDFANGPNLQDILNKNGVIALDLFIEIFLQCCAGVGHAHRKGIVHRDMKPSNVIVSQTEEGWTIKVLDFGIAKMADSGDQALTRQGMVLGSPLYMSPEQCRNEELDGRSDLYSIGIMMFQSLTGNLPFVGKDAFETLIKHVHEPPPMMAHVRPDLNIPIDMQKIVSRALAKELVNRYQTADDMIRDLQVFRSQLLGLPPPPLLNRVGLSTGDVPPSQAPNQAPSQAPGQAPSQIGLATGDPPHNRVSVSTGQPHDWTKEKAPVMPTPPAAHPAPGQNATAPPNMGAPGPAPPGQNWGQQTGYGAPSSAPAAPAQPYQTPPAQPPPPPRPVAKPPMPPRPAGEITGARQVIGAASNAAGLLQLAGLIDAEDLNQARTVVGQVGGDPAAILVASGKLDRHLLDAARKCKSAIDRGEMTESKSCVVLNYCYRAKCDYDVALEELGMR